MRDKELMALAAEVAGKADLDDGCGGYYDQKEFRFWVPLHEDGDAHRLAVDLCFRLSVFDDHAELEYTFNGTVYCFGAKYLVSGNPPIGPGLKELDKYAVVRRLIVEVAADLAVRRRDLKVRDGA